MSNLNTSLRDTSLIIATYNEEESLPFVLNEIKEYNFGEVIIVDGYSTDNTEMIAKEYGATFIKQDEKGWGSAVLQGISVSTKKYITYMDGDGSYNPIAILEMKSLIQNYDAVFSNDDFTHELFGKRGKKIIPVELKDRQNLSGTNIRQMIKDAKFWEDFVPDGTRNVLNMIDAKNRLQDL